MHARPIALEIVSDSGLVIRGPGLNAQYVNNYLGKIKLEAYFLSDRFGYLSDLYSLVAVCLIASILVLVFRYWINVAK